MSTEFNYARAWREWAAPAFDAWMKHPAFAEAWKAACELAPKVCQMRDLNRLAWDLDPSKEITLPKEFDVLALEFGPVNTWVAGYIANYYGHWMPGEAERDGLVAHNNPAGAHWKFEKLVNRAVFASGGSEAIHQQKLAFEKRVKEFCDHKPGTDYDDDEAAKMFRGVSKLAIEKRRAVNYRIERAGRVIEAKGHPFCIGAAHFPKDGGMFIEPRQAPCAMRGCGYDYDDHKSDLALFVKAGDMTEKQLGAELQRLKDFAAKHNKAYPKDQLRVDGFALVDWKRETATA